MEWFADVFKEATEAHGGVIARDDKKQGIRYLASTFPGIEKAISKEDTIEGGLALKLTSEQAHLSVFTLRLFCSNGLISTISRDRQIFSSYDEVQFEGEVHLRYSRLATTLSDTAKRFRNAQQQLADERMWQYVVESLNRLHARDNWREELMRALMEEVHSRPTHRFFWRRRRSNTNNPFNRFQLINAVTALARDTEEPELRWEMERLGGELLTTPEEPRAKGQEKSASRERKPLVLK